jgi:hypothetical protein
VTPAQDLLSLTQPVLVRCSTWTGRSWRHRVAAGNGSAASRADVTFAAIVTLADLAAEIESRPRRDVPRLDDSALLDQLAVMVHDIAGTENGEACQQASAIVGSLADLLWT